MSGPPLTPSHLRAVARKVFKKDPDARAIGMRSELPWVGPGELAVDERALRVVWCPSVLAFREELIALDAAPGATILITNQPDAALGLDAVARLSKQRLLPTDPWQTVKDLFGALRADARLANLPWMAEMLIEIAPAAGYPDAASGFLDMDRAWSPVLTALGFGSSRPDARAVLEWSTVSANVTRFRELAPAVRRDIQARVLDSAGTLGELMVHAAVAGRPGDVLALGLVIQVVHGQDSVIPDAAVRLEKYFGGRSLPPELAAPWVSMVEEHLTRPVPEPGRERPGGVLARAGEILDDVRASEGVGRSRWLPGGLARRRAQLSQAFARLFARPEPSAVAAVEAAARSLLDHRAMAEGAEGARVVAMLERMARKLALVPSPAAPASVAQAVHAYGSDGSFVDWARRVVWTWGAQVLEQDQLRALHERVLEGRERENRQFAALLSAAKGSAPIESGVLPIESVLGRVVAPLASERHVLLIVLDGVSVPVMRELVSTFRKTSWVELGPESLSGGAQRRLFALAAFPTVTEVCRASLLSGALARGGQTEEKVAFRDHAGLRRACGARNPPLLFHKAELTDGIGNLASAVLEAVEDQEHRVVAAVVNAVDDHLAKGDQIAVPWSLESLPLVAGLVQAAQRANRIVVLTSDHGHVIERDCVHQPDASGGDRWRKPDRPASDQEVHLAGPRVLGGSGRGVVVPWSETVRYTSKKNGYHGGVSLQEAVVPLVVLTSAANPPAGWIELPEDVPPWWVSGQERVVEAPAVDAGPRALAPVAVPPTGQPNLFTYQAPARASAPGASWIDELVGSERFREQAAMVQRAAVPEDRLRRLLAVLDERGGKLSLPALARALEVPQLRVTGVLASVRRMLNVDGYPVISVEDEDVILNRELLLTQFEIGGR